MTRFPKCSPLAWVVGLASTLLLAIVVPILGHGGNIDGAIFTSNFDGTVVNENTRYGGKNEVYLNGGPQNTSANSIPDGFYYYQITDPSGKDLLSNDDITCRVLKAHGGRVYGVPDAADNVVLGNKANPSCYHAEGILNPANGVLPVQMGSAVTSPQWFLDTPNNGGEYKAWITPVNEYVPAGSGSKVAGTNQATECRSGNPCHGFEDSHSKTDNFKIKESIVRYADVSVCKFNDMNGDGIQGSDEPYLANWRITATGQASQLTGADGCVTFTYAPSGDKASAQAVNNYFSHLGLVTFTEVNQPGWTQTAPAGPNTIRLTASADAIHAPNFGNHFTEETCTANCDPLHPLTASKTATPHFNRTFTWTIAKVVDQTRYDLVAGEPATFNYTVTVTHDAGTDSGFSAAGVIAVTNPNSVDVAGVTVIDSLEACTITDDHEGVTIGANSTRSFNYSCDWDGNPGSVVNVATVEVSGGATVSAPGATIDFATVTPHLVDASVTVADALAVEAPWTLTSDDASPTTFEYSKVVTAPSGTCTTVENTATFTTSDSKTQDSASRQVKVCGGVDLTVEKTAVPAFTRTYNWELSKSVTDGSRRQADPNASFNYTVNAGQTGFSDSGWAVTGTMTVTNPNAWEVPVTLTDSLAGCTITGGTTTVAANSVSVAEYSCTLTSGESGTNTVTATWDASAAHTAHSSAQGSANYALTTPTSVSNKTVTVTDAFNGGAGAELGTLTATDATPYASATYTYGHDVTGVAGTCTTYDNTARITETSQDASAQATLCVGANLTVGKSAVPAFTRTYKWELSKHVDNELLQQAMTAATFNYTVNAGQLGFTDSAWAVTGTITVTNPNAWAVPVTLTDSLAGCTITGGTTTVAANSTSTADYSCPLTSGAGGTNTVTATWDASTAYTTNSSAEGAANYAFTTPTSVSNKTVTVTDTSKGELGTLTATDATPFALAAYTYARPVTGVAGTCTTYDNTATITETGQSASQGAKLCVGADLRVSKTATGSFNSAITKAVDKTRVEQANGTATFNYTVNVTASGWNVAGSITVTNPNDWEAITANVSDALGIAGNCVVNNGTSSVNVAATATVTLPYACTFSAAPSLAASTNTATATWSGAFTPNTSASGSAGFSFAPLTVTDTFNGTPQNFGPIAGNVAATAFTYSKTVPNATFGQCSTYNNTAVINETGASASKSVNACNTATGGLTMGFWQNRNGQAVIKAASQAALKAYLTQYAPFQNIGTQVIATYVTNVIKAANASGASMNAMLKAQMLATALDVFTSTKGLGGVSIDLTMVNKAIGSLNYENVSSSFGGANSLTVSQMLAYAASQSNVGGTIWYGQVKNGPNSQELAKDAFDAINNEVAWIAP